MNLIPPRFIIIGMHRSGTSLAAKLVAELGIYIGEDLNNHAESLTFKSINETLLSEAGASWARPQPFLARLTDPADVEDFTDLARQLLALSGDLYGWKRVSRWQGWTWKEPRNTLTLPIWLKIFPNTKVVHVLRNGIDVALSLYRRESRKTLRNLMRKRAERQIAMFPPTIGTGFRLWQTYVEQENRLRQSLDSALWHTIRYENLLACPDRKLLELADFAGINQDPIMVRDISTRLLHPQRQRSKWEEAAVALLLCTGRLDRTKLSELGYQVAQS